MPLYLSLWDNKWNIFWFQVLYENWLILAKSLTNMYIKYQDKRKSVCLNY
jgi:hypothetical protein